MFEPILINYHENPAFSVGVPVDQPRFFGELDLTNLGVPGSVKKLAIYQHQKNKTSHPYRTTFATQVAGLDLEADSLEQLAEAVGSTLRALVRYERLPKYIFQVKRKAWPIYHLPDQLLARYPGGPVFSAADIASLRLWLAEHFKTVGRIRNRREMALYSLSQQDLRLYPPYCVLRIPDKSIADIPVFPALDSAGLRLITAVQEKSLNTPFSYGTGIFTVWSRIGGQLIQEGSLEDIFDLTIRKLSGPAWEELQKSLEPQPHHLTYQRTLDGEQVRIFQPIFLYKRLYLTARVNRLGRTVLYLANDIRRLQKQVGKDLFSYGAIENIYDVEIYVDESNSATIL